MAVNKVVFGAVSIMDISDSTVTPETLAEGEIAYQADGEKITGTMQAGLDTSDATATASDIRYNKTAYVKGEKITGDLRNAGNIAFSNFSEIKDYPSLNCVYVCGTKSSSDNSVCTNTTLGETKAPYSEFGDATAEDVMSSKTFTSTAGLKVTGTIEELVTGRANCVVSTYEDEIKLTTTPASKSYCIKAGKTAWFRAPLSEFGDATAEDVAKGKTFTSASGLLVTGTKEESTADPTLNAEVQTIADVTAPTATFNGTGGTYKVYGYGKGTTSMYTTPMYAFCGDKYYKSASYGSPSSTTMTISVDESGNISGLPSLTDGKLIIVREP